MNGMIEVTFYFCCIFVVFDSLKCAYLFLELNAKYVFVFLKNKPFLPKQRKQIANLFPKTFL